MNFQSENQREILAACDQLEQALSAFPVVDDKSAAIRLLIEEATESAYEVAYKKPRDSGKPRKAKDTPGGEYKS